LDAADVGAYMLLLMAQWNRDGGSLPNDTKKLQRVARCGRNWAKVWGNIERFFMTDDDGIYSNRLRFEAQNVASKREANARNGALGGKAKALKTNNADLANANETLQRNATIPEPEPELKKEDTKVSLSVSPPAIDEIAECVSAYNAAAKRTGWPVVKVLSKARRAALRGRLRDAGGADGWRIAIEKAEASDFLTGRASKQFFASFDFITQQSSFTKLMEGNYDNRINNSQQNTNGRGNRPDPALEQALRLAGLDGTPGAARN